jgi:integrase
VSGRVIQKSAETESRREALDTLKAEILKHANGDAVASGRVTVDDLYSVLLADYRINDKSLSWAERTWNIHLKPFFGLMQAKVVGTDTLSRYIESRRAEKAANGSINRELSLLQRAFMLGYESQPRKVARPLRFHRLAESKPRQGFIEQKQYDALAANCSGLFMRTMLALAYSFGFRKAELLTLKVSDVNLLASTLQLRDSKNGEPRKVSLTGDAKNLLSACIAGKSPEDAVFTRGKGKAVSDFRKTWDKVTLAAGCPGLLFHDLRRSAVRNMVRGGIPETVCMKISGHKTRNVFDRYNITSERDLADAARKIEISQRQAKVAEIEQEAQQTEPVTIQ